MIDFHTAKMWGAEILNAIAGFLPLNSRTSSGPAQTNCGGALSVRAIGKEPGQTLREFTEAFARTREDRPSRRQVPLPATSRQYVRAQENSCNISVNRTS